MAPELLSRRRSGLLRPAGDLRPAESAARPGESARHRQPRRYAAVAVLLPQRRGAVRPRPAPRRVVGRAARRIAGTAAAGRSARARRRARRFLQHWRAQKDRLPIARLLGTVFADSGYDAATQFEFLGDRKLANLWKLLDLARTFDRSGLFGLAEFIARLGDFVRTQPREEQAATQPENADVVRLMTIHQAKGLEFPVVIVPDFAANFRNAFAPVVVWDDELGCVARPPADEEEPPFPAFGSTAVAGVRRHRGMARRPADSLRCLHPRPRLPRAVGGHARDLSAHERLDASAVRAFRSVERPLSRAGCAGGKTTASARLRSAESAAGAAATDCYGRRTSDVGRRLPRIAADRAAGRRCPPGCGGRIGSQRLEQPRLEHAAQASGHLLALRAQLSLHTPENMLRFPTEHRDFCAGEGKWHS